MAALSASRNWACASALALELLALLFGENALLYQLEVTVRLLARILGVGRIAIQIGLGLQLQRRALLQIRYRGLHLAFQGLAIDQEQKVAFFDVIAFLEIDLGEHAARLRPHRDHRIGLHVADHRNVHRNVL